MPASVTDASSFIEESLRSSIVKNQSHIDQKVISSSKKVLLHNIDFQPAQSSSSFQLDTLKAKYTTLNPSAKKAEKSQNERVAGKVNFHYPISWTVKCSL